MWSYEFWPTAHHTGLCVLTLDFLPSDLAMIPVPLRPIWSHHCCFCRLVRVGFGVPAALDVAAWLIFGRPI